MLQESHKNHPEVTITWLRGSKFYSFIDLFCISHRTDTASEHAAVTHNHVPAVAIEGQDPCIGRAVRIKRTRPIVATRTSLAVFWAANASRWQEYGITIFALYQIALYILY